MNILQFKLVMHFKPEEVWATGSRVEDVDLDLFLKLDTVREILNTPIHLICLTTGEHEGPWHAVGKAVDWCLPKADLDPSVVLKACLQAGFLRFGAYWNGVMRSYHTDLGTEYGFWGAKKAKNDKKWTYLPLIMDPKNHRGT